MLRNFALLALSSLQAYAFNLNAPAPPANADEPYKGDIKILAFRHGKTCANFVYDCKPDDVKWDACVKDPRNVINAGDSYLARSGLLGSKKVGENLRENSEIETPDIVFVSSMMSTMESAMMMFPGQKLYVAPWIVDTSLVNRPQPVEVQLDLMRPVMGKRVDLLDFRFIDQEMSEWDDKDCRNGEETAPDNARCQASFDGWKLWFSTTLSDPARLATLPDQLQKKIKNQENIVVAIMGHGTQTRNQIIHEDKKYKIYPNMGFYANFQLMPDTDETPVTYYLGRVDGDDYDSWPVIDGTVGYDVDECENNNWDILDRCYERNPKEWNIILTKYENPYDGCPGPDSDVTVDPYIPSAEEIALAEQTVEDPVQDDTTTSVMDASFNPESGNLNLDESRFPSNKAVLYYYNGQEFIIPETTQTN